MSDVQLKNEALAELKLVTLGWNKVKTYSVERLRATHWGKALDKLSQISSANAVVRNNAVGHLKKTTQRYSPTAKNWKAALAELAKIKDGAASARYPAASLYPSEVMS